MDDTKGKNRGQPTPSRRAVRQKLESLVDAGVLDLPRRSGVASVVAAQTVSPEQSVGMVPAHKRPAGPLPAVDPAEKLRLLEPLRAEVAGCRRCEELACARTQTVFGTGSPGARICFLGEAPGADEDASGIPFVGRAGQLLTKIIEACRLRREDVYILNVLKCRPPGNRPPTADEVANCRGFFERQLEIIGPEFICCLGTTAAQALLRSEEPIGRLRGRWFEHGDSQVICTYHPSYLLRNPAAKRHVWDDMKILMARMGVEL
jgi:DNA polymerase